MPLFSWNASFALTQSTDPSSDEEGIYGKRTVLQLDHVWVGGDCNVENTMTRKLRTAEAKDNTDGYSEVPVMVSTMS